MLLRFLRTMKHILQERKTDMKKTYENAELEIVKINSTDVISTSGDGNKELWGPDI